MIADFIKSIPKGLNCAALLALVALLVKIFYLNDIRELFSGGYEIGVIAEGLFVSTLASYIFYLIVVHYKETKDRITVSPHIQRWYNLIIQDCDTQIREMTKAAGTEMSLENFTEDGLRRAFSKLPPYSNAPILIGGTNRNGNWIEYWTHHKIRASGNLEKALSQLKYLDSSEVSVLSRIYDCSHFVLVQHLAKERFGNTDLTNFTSTFYEYCELCKELSNHTKKCA